MIGHWGPRNILYGRPLRNMSINLSNFDFIMMEEQEKNVKYQAETALVKLGILHTFLGKDTFIW